MVLAFKEWACIVDALGKSFGFVIIVFLGRTNLDSMLSKFRGIYEMNEPQTDWMRNKLAAKCGCYFGNPVVKCAGDLTGRLDAGRMRSSIVRNRWSLANGFCFGRIFLVPRLDATKMIPILRDLNRSGLSIRLITKEERKV